MNSPIYKAASEWVERKIQPSKGITSDNVQRMEDLTILVAHAFFEGARCVIAEAEKNRILYSVGAEDNGETPQPSDLTPVSKLKALFEEPK